MSSKWSRKFKFVSKQWVRQLVNYYDIPVNLHNTDNSNTDIRHNADIREFRSTLESMTEKLQFSVPCLMTWCQPLNHYTTPTTMMPTSATTPTSANFVPFLPCDALRCTVFVIVILSVCLSVRPSVHPSVTLVDCVHVVRPTIMIPSQYGSPIILVSGDFTVIPKFEGGYPDSRARALNEGGVDTNCRFLTNKPPYLRNGARYDKGYY